MKEKDRILITRHPRHQPEPEIGVIIINSRGATNPWFIQAMESVKSQSYGNVVLATVDNNDHKFTIGKAWNDAVKKLKMNDCKFVFFLGDDDAITPDLLSTLLVNFQHQVKAFEGAGHKLVGISSMCYMVNKDMVPIMPQNISAPGLFPIDTFDKYQFNELLPKLVDTDFLDRINNSIADRVAAIPFCYGYFYRQHATMVSGIKLQMQPQNTNGLKMVQ